MRLFDVEGAPIELGAVLGRGGEGEVRTVRGDETLVAKVLHAERRKTGKHRKIAAMLARPPDGAHEAIDGFPVVAWPRGLLYDSPTTRDLSTFVGYTMARIKRRDFVPLFQVTTAARRDHLGGAPVTWEALLLLGARLCHLVRTLHRFGYAVGDLNDRNVLVSRRFTPLLMDTDSFQVPKRIGFFPSLVGDQLYWPPELLGIDLATHSKSRVHGDRFALGTLLFQLFMNGNRPYQARGTLVQDLDSLMQKTQAGHFPWSSPQPGVLEPPSRAPDFAALPAPIRRAFEKCFVAGHGNPRRRPTADQWYKVLSKVLKRGFQACPRTKQHVFGADEAACPWCQDANEPFTPSTPKRRSRPRRTPTTKPKPVDAPKIAPRPSTRRPGLLALWWVGLALVLAAPMVWLWALPENTAKQAIAGAVSVAVITAPGAWAALRWLSDWRIGWLVSSAWAAGAAWGLGRLASSAGWFWLESITAAAALVLAAGLFVWLERRRGALMSPTPHSLLHWAAGLPVAYAPSMVWLGVRLF